MVKQLQDDGSCAASVRQTAAEASADAVRGAPIVMPDGKRKTTGSCELFCHNRKVLGGDATAAFVSDSSRRQRQEAQDTLSGPMRCDPEQLLTLSAVAEELGVSEETARQLTVKGLLPCVAVGTGTERCLRRVRRADLDEFKRARRQERLFDQLPGGKMIAPRASVGPSYF